MIQNKFGQLVYSEQDVCDLLMQGHAVTDLSGLVVDASIDVNRWSEIIDSVPEFLKPHQEDCTTQHFHAQQQRNWRMPESYKNLDIAQHVLQLCESQAELQRCGQELMLYQERDLFDLLRYLHYLVDVMRSNNIVWGVGRGSSVSSYVLYKLGVHRVDSLFYNLDVKEFLR